MSEELVWLSIEEAGRRMRRGDVSPVELTRAVVERIERLNPVLRGYITTWPERAIEAARRVEVELGQGIDRGPLHGIPIAIKDIIDMEGVVTTGGSRAYMHQPPAPKNAVIVERLLTAGTIPVGKTATHEVAIGGPNRDEPLPTGFNPWNTAYVTGGSSSGSGVAVASGLCLGAIGTDTGGSIRSPASHCGITGLKPTFGAVPLDGVMPLSTSMDSAGPMTRSARDARLLYGVLTGRGALGEGLQASVGGLRLGVERGFYRQPETHPEIAAAIDEVARTLVESGLQSIDVMLEMPDSMATPQQMRDVWMRFTAEAYLFHRPVIDATPELFHERPRGIVLTGRDVRAWEYLQACDERRALADRFDSLFDQCDVIVAPTTPVPPQTFDDYERNAAPPPAALSMPANLAGLAAIVVPCGFTSSGLPIGVQLIGRPGSEDVLLALGEHYQTLTDWHTRRPPLD